MNDLILLSLLLDEPKHGYRLKREAGMILGETALHNNLLYPLLRRFVAEKWVTTKEVAGERGQRRKMYSLTVRGRRELFERLSHYDEAEAQSPGAFLLRVGLFELLPAEVRGHILDERERVLRFRHERAIKLQNNMDLGTYGAECVRFRRQQLESELHWIRQLRRLAGGQASAEKRV